MGIDRSEIPRKDFRNIWIEGEGWPFIIFASRSSSSRGF